jgi:hypothetical protein
VGDSILPGDARASKIVTIPRTSRSSAATTYDSPLALASNLTGPLPLIRDAELILLRAQAEIGLGNLSAATADINVVHRVEGGLPNYPTFTSASQAISALLYEKRYSLLLEAGASADRLVDLRSYNRLNATFLKADVPGDLFQTALPIPKGESDLRNGNVTCQ